MKNRIKIIVAFIFFITTFFSLGKVIFEPDFPDFRAHYYGAKKVLYYQNPYDFDSNYFTNQAYPPLDFVLVVPFLLFEYSIAAKLWIFLSFIALFYSILKMFEIVSIKIKSVEGLIIAGLFFLSFPLKFSFGMGQVNIILLSVLIAILSLINSQRYYKAGIISSVLFQIKFYPLLFIPYFIFAKKYLYVKGVILGTILIIFLLIFLGLGNDIKYFYLNVLPDLLSSWKDSYYNQSLNGVIARFTESNSIRSIMKVGLSTSLLMLVAVFIFLHNKKKHTENIVLSLLLTLSVLVNNFSWQHHFIFLFPAYIFVFSHIKKMKNKFILSCVLLSSYFLVSFNMIDPSIYPVLLQSHVFWGGLLLLGTELYVLYKL